MLDTVTGHVGSVTTSAVKSLDASAKSLDASAKYFGLVGGVFVASAAQDWSSGKDTATATHFWTCRHITFIALVLGVFGEMGFQDIVYISLDSMTCVIKISDTIVIKKVELHYDDL